MKKLASFRISLTIKILILVLAVVLITDFTIGFMAFRISSKNLKQSIFDNLSALSEDSVHKIEALNEKQFTALHFLSELEFI